MEEEKPASRVSSANPAPPLPPPLPPLPVATNQRQRFSVDLRPGETTIVSWKKLVKDSNKAGLPLLLPEAPPGARPGLESRIAPAAVEQGVNNETKDAPTANRFSAVIEKIERLYMGQHSSDEEELDNVPDDDEYDTEDSFIDDAELDEYFEVDNSALKHSGFFVNRGKLERKNEPASSENQGTKKRRRKDLKVRGEDVENTPTKLAKVSNVRMKAAARNAALAAPKSAALFQTSIPSMEDHHQYGKPSPHQSNANVGPSQKMGTGSPTKFDQPSLNLANRDSSLHPMDAKDVRRQKTGVTQSRDLGHKSKIFSESSYVGHMEPLSTKFVNDSSGTDISTKVRQREKNGSSELHDMSFPVSKYNTNPMKSPSVSTKEGSSVRPKGTMLERAIRDLEKVVTECKIEPTQESPLSIYGRLHRNFHEIQSHMTKYIFLPARPPIMQVQELDAAAQGTKKRLPQDIKQKLAKVARLAQSSQGRISEELINHLMNILGHLVQLKTLKRHLKEMVELGLSAKQHKADRLQQVKKEVIEMIRARSLPFRSKAAEQQDGSSGDFQEVRGSEEKGASQLRFNMDEAMEDKIFDLYELYVEGMDEDRGPQSRKLYVELADLWPTGSIDSNGIKSAVSRARERKKQLYMKQKTAEKMKRKRLSAAVRTDAIVRADASLSAQPRIIHDSGAQVFTSAERTIPSQLTSAQYLSAPGKSSILALNAAYPERQRPEKAKGSIITTAEEIIRINEGGILKKKVKRKPNLESVEMHGHSSKLASQHKDKERQRSQKQHSASIPQKQALPPMMVPGCEQPS